MKLISYQKIAGLATKIPSIIVSGAFMLNGCTQDITTETKLEVSEITNLSDIKIEPPVPITKSNIVFNDFKEALKKEGELDACFEDIYEKGDESSMLYASVGIEMGRFIFIVKEIINSEDVFQENEFIIMDSDEDDRPNYVKGTNLTKHYLNPNGGVQTVTHIEGRHAGGYRAIVNESADDSVLMQDWQDRVLDTFYDYDFKTCKPKHGRYIK